MVNILCIDNSKTIRQVIKDCILDLNYGFYEAENGMTGLEMVETIDNLFMIIVDWNMPGISGRETLRRIKENTKISGVLCLVLIRIENKEEVMEAIDLGANNYMLKPFSVNKLQEKIEEMIKNAV
jgi:two-component system chemotaxis response regulator CheY